MIKKIYILVLLLSVQLIFSEKFKFKFYPGSKQKIEAVINGEQRVNGKKILNYEQKYKTIRKVMDTGDLYAIIEDVFYFYNQNKLLTDTIMEIKDESIVVYAKDTSGKMIVDSLDVFPTFRTLPHFPDVDMKPGYEWNSDAIEVQDLFGDEILSYFPIDVSYKFIGYATVDKRKVAKFSYEHDLFLSNDYSGRLTSRIDRVKGVSKTIMYFDNVKGGRVREEYQRHYSFLINDGGQKSLIEFIDNGERNWFEIELLDKDKLVDDLKKYLKDEKIEETSVKKDDKGVKLSVENIHFHPDSSKLLPEETYRLEKIANILKKYKDKGIMVIGHTTDKGTEKGRLKLSVERAKSVVDFLIEQDSINVLKSSFGGKGGNEPIADNNTSEGMKKNRRVEIYILEE